MRGVSEIEFPGRSLIGMESVPAEQGGGILIKCDCATTTHLVVDIPDGVSGDHEIAVTCDGCHTVNWLMIRLG
jgi:hypothetical protein